MSEQDWEDGRDEAIARAIADVVKDQYQNNGRFYQLVLDDIDELWTPTIRPFPSNAEVNKIVDEMLAAWLERQAAAGVVTPGEGEGE